MKIPKILFLATLVLLGSVAVAHQTGTAIGTTPGSAARNGITVTRIIPRPTCEATASAGGEVNSVPEMEFGRSWDDLVCVRHADGRTEQLRTDQPKGVASADGSAIAYWNEKKQELRLYSTASHSDVLVESLPGAKLREMVWSARGNMLSYFPTSASPAGIRSYDADTGKWVLFGGSYIGLVAPPDSSHVVAIGADGVKSLSLADATGEVTAKVKYAASAEYSRRGKYLGILGNSSIADQNAPAAPAAQAPADADDGPDCTGGSFALILQDVKTK